MSLISALSISLDSTFKNLEELPVAISDKKGEKKRLITLSANIECKNKKSAKKLKSEITK
jgi:hypothetical protein